MSDDVAAWFHDPRSELRREHLIARARTGGGAQRNLPHRRRECTIDALMHVGVDVHRQRRYLQVMSVRWSILVCLGGSVAGCFSPDRAAGDGTDGTTGDTSNSSTMPTGGPTTLDDSSSNATPPDTSVSETTPPETTDPDATDPDSSSEDTSPPVDCDGADGEPDAACPADATFCLGGTCVDCDALADSEAGCTGLDPTTPVCGGGVCLGCGEHEECGSGACRMLTGECFGMPNRLWVDNNNCDAGVGTEDAPLCSVVDAVGVIDGQAGDEPWAVFVAGSPTPYVGTVDTSSARPIAIIGPDQGLSATLEGNAGPAIDLWSQSPETYLAHVTLTSTSTPATIRGGGTCHLELSDVAMTVGSVALDTNGCDVRARRTLITNSFDTNVVVGGSGSLITDDVEISDASNGMIINGTATLQRTRVWGHYVGGGVTLTGSLDLINSIIHQNEYTNDGLANDGGDLRMLYSTVVGAVTCTNGATATIRNSIVVGHASEAGQVCAAAVVDYSVVNQGAGQGTGNVVVAPADLPNIFVDSAQYEGDYHVLVDSVPSGVAVWEEGHPVVDFDGDERPGAGDYAGADIP